MTTTNSAWTTNPVMSDGMCLTSIPHGAIASGGRTYGVAQMV